MTVGRVEAKATVVIMAVREVEVMEVAVAITKVVVVEGPAMLQAQVMVAVAFKTARHLLVRPTRSDRPTQ
jgi:hypothetical protein